MILREIIALLSDDRLPSNHNSAANSLLCFFCVQTHSIQDLWYWAMFCSQMCQVLYLICYLLLFI